MILVRTTLVDLGKQMANELRLARKEFGLVQKFAIIVDVEEQKGMTELLKKDWASSCKSEEEWGWVTRLRRLHGKVLTDIEKKIRALEKNAQEATEEKEKEIIL